MTKSNCAQTLNFPYSFFFLNYLFIYFWLRWVVIAARNFL